MIKESIGVYEDRPGKSLFGERDALGVLADGKPTSRTVDVGVSEDKGYLGAPLKGYYKGTLRVPFKGPGSFRRYRAP